MGKPVVLVVAYPSTTPEGSKTKFNMDHYTSTHMSIISRNWTPYGMKNCTITEYDPKDSLDGSTPPYCVQATVQFDSMEGMKDALAKGSKESGEDVANYTDVTPVIWVSKLVTDDKDWQA